LKILLLEDDRLFGESLEDFLNEAGFCVIWAEDGQTALEYIYDEKFDLLLLDINVPYISGLELLKQIRATHNNTPAIFLTSFKDKETLASGFESGCDDYLKKPFDLDELLMRIDAIMKRSGKHIKIIDFKNGYYFDMQEKRVCLEGQDISMPQKMLDLLMLFIDNKNKIISKELIETTVWGYDEEFSDGSLRVYITKLKKIVGNESLHNFKGIGYKLSINE